MLTTLVLPLTLSRSGNGLLSPVPVGESEMGIELELSAMLFMLTP